MLIYGFSPRREIELILQRKVNSKVLGIFTPEAEIQTSKIHFVPMSAWRNLKNAALKRQMDISIRIIDKNRDITDTEISDKCIKRSLYV